MSLPKISRSTVLAVMVLAAVGGVIAAATNNTTAIAGKPTAIVVHHVPPAKTQPVDEAGCAPIGNYIDDVYKAVYPKAQNVQVTYHWSTLNGSQQCVASATSVNDKPLGLQVQTLFDCTSRAADTWAKTQSPDPKDGQTHHDVAINDPRFTFKKGASDAGASLFADTYSWTTATDIAGYTPNGCMVFSNVTPSDTSQAKALILGAYKVLYYDVATKGTQ